MRSLAWPLGHSWFNDRFNEGDAGVAARFPFDPVTAFEFRILRNLRL
jgi:hypothetical protein